MNERLMKFFREARMHLDREIEGETSIPEPLPLFMYGKQDEDRRSFPNVLENETNRRLAALVEEKLELGVIPASEDELIAEYRTRNPQI